MDQSWSKENNASLPVRHELRFALASAFRPGGGQGAVIVIVMVIGERARHNRRGSGQQSTGSGYPDARVREACRAFALR
jgi:hypothetical protein